MEEFSFQSSYSPKGIHSEISILQTTKKSVQYVFSLILDNWNISFSVSLPFPFCAVLYLSPFEKSKKGKVDDDFFGMHEIVPLGLFHSGQ